MGIKQRGEGEGGEGAIEREENIPNIPAEPPRDTLNIFIFKFSVQNKTLVGIK